MVRSDSYYTKNYVQNLSHLRISALATNSRAVDLRLNTLDIRAREQVRSTWALDIHILNVDVRAHRWTRADHIANKRVVLLASSALEVLDGDIGDGKVRRELSLR